jgi:hypothetical protein
MEKINNMDFVTFITHIKNKSLPEVHRKPRPKLLRSSVCTYSNFISRLYSIYFNRDQLQFVDIDSIISSNSFTSNNGKSFYNDLEENYKYIIHNYNHIYDTKTYDCKLIDLLDDSEFSDTTSIGESSLFSSNDEDYYASWNNRSRSLSSTS